MSASSICMQIVGCNHHRSPVELRERMAIPAGRLPSALNTFRQRFPKTEGVLLSTCNRTELYTAGDVIPPRNDLAGFLAELCGQGETVRDQLFCMAGEEAIEHLFMVAASLDSMVLGETQIAKQVKDAYRVATEKASAGQFTHRAFQAALRASKRIATETSLHASRVSVASVAVHDFAGRIFDDLSRKSILVIGAGETATETVRALLEEGCTEITVVNRNRERGRQLAEEFHARDRDWEELASLIEQADVVISATGANQRIMDRAAFDPISTRRDQRPMMILDLAIPRDFEPSIGDCLGVYLYTIDDLASVCELNREQRELELPRAQKIIRQETRRFMIELNHNEATDTIRQLRTNAHQVQEFELNRLLNKLPELSPEQRDLVEQSFTRLTNKLLHPPLESLRSDARDSAGLLLALRRLFQIED